MGVGLQTVPVAKTTHGLNRSATDISEDAERAREKRTKVGRKCGGKGKERKREVTGALTRAAYAPVGRASIHDNSHGASLCRAYRGAGAFESRSYRGRDLRLARELHGGFRPRNKSRDRPLVQRSHGYTLDCRSFLVCENLLPSVRSFVPVKPANGKPLRCRRTTILFILR